MYQLPDETAKFAPVWTTILKISATCSEFRERTLLSLVNSKQVQGQVQAHGSPILTNTRIPTRSHYTERAPALDFKDVPILRCGHSDVVYRNMFFCI